MRAIPGASSGRAGRTKPIAMRLAYGWPVHGDRPGRKGLRLARTRRGQVVIAVVVVAAAFTLVAIAAPRRGFFDLKVYFGAINFWAHGHGEVYDFLQPFTKYGFTYPPF